jgi:V-type H+-transporting ATPase subunit a
VDTYGTPTYEEANPAYLSIPTFPFFFGMMFGDMGHGSVLVFFSLILIFNAKKLKAAGGKAKMVAMVRYLFFIMGMMSCWAGLLYNEFFAMPTNIFGSCYEFNEPFKHNGEKPEPGYTKGVMFKRLDSKCVYPFGQDPVWSAAENKLTLVNSIKMKMSVIFGVFHMSLGVLCKGTNLINRGHYVDFLTEVIAGFVILWGLFGWMDALILAKFFKTPDIEDCSSKAENGKCIGRDINEKTPGIIGIMITTVFGFGNYDKTKPRLPIIGSSQDVMYNYSLLLLFSAIVCIPIMLCTKPMLFSMSAKK